MSTQSEPLAESLAPHYGAAGEPGNTWASRGQPWTLMLRVSTLFGQQFFMLITIVIAIFKGTEYLMNCNPQVTNVWMANVCEYTKAHVRCFPLLALVVTVFATCRVFLYLRIYYQLLKRNILVKFEPYPPYKDPLFLIMLICMSQAVLHFVLNIITVWSIGLNVKSAVEKVKAEEFQQDVYELTAFYMIPAVLFFVLFYGAYDVSELVLPFSKYFDDHENALKDVASLSIIHEVVAMRTVQYDLVAQASEEGRGGASRKTCLEDALYAKFLSEAENNDSGTNLSVWRLSATWWPARLLLDTRVSGIEALQFRVAWWVLLSPLLGVLAFVFWYCYYFISEKIDDINEGQHTDVIALVVGLAITVYIVYLGFKLFLKTTILPVFGHHFKHFAPSATR